MRTCDLHGRRYLLATLLALACLTLSAHRAAGQTYTQTSQTRSMRAEVTARVPGRPDVTDVQTEESMELGSFDRSISASATASEGGVMVTVQGNASQRVAYLADSITGVLTAQTTTETIGGDSAARVFSFFQPYFRVSDAGNVPYVLTGRIRGNFGPLDGTVTVGLALVDEDTPDPHGNGTLVFNQQRVSDSAFDLRFEDSGFLLAGHVYTMPIQVIATREFFNDSAPPGNIQRFIDAEASFNLIIPEPAGLGLTMLLIMLLSGRQRRARDMTKSCG